MKIFVAGARGFIGRNVSDILESQGNEVYRGTRPMEDSMTGIDLLNQKDIEQKFSEMQPDVIINCAGVVSKEGDFEDNVRMSRNLLNATAAIGLYSCRFVMCGSAGEYGIVSREDWPVSEKTPLRGASPYAQSKIKEEEVVKDLASRYNIDAIVARIFNPIGNDMPAKYLISNVLTQIEKVKSGESSEIVVSRADALRDYINVKDVARALALLATKDHGYDIYNIGSGISTSTAELVQCIIEESGAPLDCPIRELNGAPEQSVASQADISRLVDEFGWRPQVALHETIKGAILS